jgi:hypothetical protein
MIAANARSSLLVGTATLLASVGWAAVNVATHARFGRSDLVAMTLWSLPLAIGMAVLMPRLVARLRSGNLAHAYAILVSSGLLVGGVWTIAAAIVLGAWIAAFSFPVLVCWSIGGLVGGAVAAWLKRPQSWPIAVLVVGLGASASVRVNAYASAPAPAIRVVIKPNATEGEIHRVWTDVVGRRIGQGEEHHLLPSLSSVGADAYEGRSVVLVARFWRGTSKRTRDSVIAEITRSPLVVRVDTVEAR